jgi:uncharacterized membrane protein
MARWFSWGPSISYRGRKFKGLRGFSGKPFHPPLTDFPVTAYILAGIFDLISFSKGEHSRTATDFFRAGTYVLVAGGAVSLLTALTGFWDWLKSTPKHTQVWRTANSHMALMLATTVIVLIDIILRLSYWNDGYAQLPVMILSLLALVLVSAGSFYGGSLVYDYGFNVENASDLPQYHESERDLYADQKTALSEQ